MTENVYLDYILSRVDDDDVLKYSAGLFSTKRTFEADYNAFKMSSKDIININENTVIHCLHELVHFGFELFDTSFQFFPDNLLDDAKTLYIRSKEKLRRPQECAERFNLLADYLWILASVIACRNRNVSLLSSSESIYKNALHFISELPDISDKLARECESIETASKIMYRIFTGVCPDPVAQNYIMQNYSPMELKELAARYDRERILVKYAFYSFTATLILAEKMRHEIYG